MARNQITSRSTTEATAAAREPNSARGNKSAFIRSMPLEMSVKDIIAKARSEGLTLSIPQIYYVRAAIRTEGKLGNAPTDARTLKSTAQLQLIRSKATGTDGNGDEARLRKLIAELGLGRAREVMAEVAAAFEG